MQIARTIAETLKPEETAILFIGAYHNVRLYLPPDIVVVPLKEPHSVKAYFEELTSGRAGKDFAGHASGERTFIHPDSYL